MTVGVLLVTHGKLGHHLLETMQDMIGPLPLNADVLEVRRVQATDVLLLQGRRMIERLDGGHGVLILTDAYGSTPSNIASRLLEAPRTEMVAGVNLPMLVEIFNFPKRDLPAMVAAAVDGGQTGIVSFKQPGSPS
ncbi:MAG: PTS fructose transporter subunit IIA [Nevskia sp.]|jgi:PTS system mannose-specific IIA component|nr:PTS fructose transporter subunit IIA [Gammaproteobacteria bacterium]MDH4458141.1 PTS fructose transporter subunit IIA [Nevskia sp.]